MPTPKKPLFLNLSNHPSSSWSEAQRVAGEQYGEIVDFPFPNISPTATATEVKQLAEKTAQDIVKQYPNAHLTVHLMGEMTFTYALVQRLTTCGITCVAATSERLVEEMEDGRKVVQFNFVQFRTY